MHDASVPFFMRLLSETGDRERMRRQGNKGAPPAAEVLGFDVVALSAAFGAFVTEPLYTPTGCLTPTDLVRALSLYSPRKLSKADAQDLVSSLETNAQGFINYKEWITRVGNESGGTE